MPFHSGSKGARIPVGTADRTGAAVGFSNVSKAARDTSSATSIASVCSKTDRLSNMYGACAALIFPTSTGDGVPARKGIPSSARDSVLARQGITLRLLLQGRF